MESDTRLGVELLVQMSWTVQVARQVSQTFHEMYWLPQQSQSVLDKGPKECMFDHLCMRFTTGQLVLLERARLRIKMCGPPTLAMYLPCSCPAMQKHTSLMGAVWPDARFPNIKTTGSSSGRTETSLIFSSEHATTSSRSQFSENSGERVLGDQAIAVTLEPTCMELSNA